MRDHPVSCLRLGAVNTVTLAEPHLSCCAKNHTPKSASGRRRGRQVLERPPDSLLTACYSAKSCQVPRLRILVPRTIIPSVRDWDDAGL